MPRHSGLRSAMQRLCATIALAFAAVVVAPGCGPSDAAPPVLQPDTLRRTALGPVIGFVTEDGAHAWRGIPFARPPVGDLRWRAPRPPAPWTTPREALAFGSKCMQFAPPGGDEDAAAGEPTGSEDCLYLNVYAPRFAADAVPQGDARLPVMFWIHGGGNTIGSADVYDGSLLAVKHDVVVVAVHYRLGAFGWLSHPALRTPGTSAEDASGNYGTLDLVRALEWVQGNIAAFGGDPDRVLVFGESAGGTNTFSMLLSPLAKGLFQRAIVQSGGAGTMERAEAEHYSDDPALPGVDDSSQEVVARLLVRKGRAADRAQAVQVAAERSPGEIATMLRDTAAGEILGLYEGSGLGGMYGAPDLFRDGHVLPKDDPIEAFARGAYNQVPTILGSNRDESRLFMAFGSDHVTKLFGLPLWINDEALYLANAQYSTQMWKIRGVDSAADVMRGAQGPSVYAYRFDWDDEAGFLWLDLQTLLGAAHAFEIPFVFGWLTMGQATPMLFAEENAASDRWLSDAMMSYWTHFAHEGTPGRGRDGALAEWTPWSHDAATPKLMILDVQRDGGLRMSPRSLTREGVLAEIERDPRLAEARDRCEVVFGLMRFGAMVTEDDYAARCPDHPADAYD